LFLSVWSSPIYADEFTGLHALTFVEISDELARDPENLTIHLALIRKLGQTAHAKAIAKLDNIQYENLSDGQKLYYVGISCSILVRKGDMSTATYYCEEIADLLNLGNDCPICLAIGRNALGYYYARQGKPELALKHFQMGLSNVAGDVDRALKVMLMHNQGVALMLSGMKDLAIKAFEGADREKSSLAADDPLPNLLVYNLGYMQAQSGQHQEALKSYAAALPWLKNSNQRAREYIAHTQISLSLTAIGNYQAALNELLPWMEKETLTVTPDSEAQAYLAIANAYRGLGNIVMTELALVEGIRIAREAGNPSRLNELSLVLGEIFLDNEDYDAALKILNSLFVVLNKGNITEGKETNLRLLARAYAGMGEYSEAYKHSMLASDAQRVSQDSSYQRRLASLRVSNELDLKDQELALSIQRESTARASQRLAQFYQIVTIVGLVVVFVIFFLLLSRRTSLSEAKIMATSAEKLSLEVEMRTLEVEEELIKRYAAENEQAALELKLVKNEKLRSIGQLTGGVAHDFNNLLTIILMSAELLLSEAKEESRGLLEDIIGATSSGRAITKGLLAYAKQQTLRPSVIELDKYIESHRSLFQRSLDESIEFRVLPFKSDAPVCIKADEGQLTSCMINLLFNAKEACDENGFIEVSIYDDNALVTISVRDNGKGMTEKQVKQAIEPFYSTKDASEGAGLGLSMVYGFMEQSGGQLRIESEENIGSTLTLSFDKFSGDPFVDNNEQDEDKKTTVRNATILLVEDELRIRDICTVALEKAGHKILIAENGDVAKKILAEENDIDLMVSDLVMPGSTSGEKLALYVNEYHPNVSVLLMSGYTQDIPSKYPFLAKPFSLRELRESVRAALEKKFHSSQGTS
jgi:signal transduction histidine kinase/CheY-like chemotaxis protein